MRMDFRNTENIVWFMFLSWEQFEKLFLMLVDTIIKLVVIVLAVVVLMAVGLVVKY